MPTPPTPITPKLHWVKYAGKEWPTTLQRASELIDNGVLVLLADTPDRALYGVCQGISREVFFSVGL